MTIFHRLVLYALLSLVGLSLAIPGLVGILKPRVGQSSLAAESLEGKNQLRAVNAMMGALGVIALWACVDLVRFRYLVKALGVVMLLVVIARVYSLIVDGLPNRPFFVYLAVEAVAGLVFLMWPPPASGSS
jgi:hypothetical protein